MFRISMIAAAVWLFAAPAASAAERLTVLTGGRTGVYYWIGMHICDEIRRESRSTRPDCRVRATRGSAYNIRALLNGEGDLAVAQADVVDALVRPDSVAAAKPEAPRINGVAMLHREPLAILLQPGAKAAAVGQLLRYRMALGEPESGHRMTGLAVLRRLAGRAPVEAQLPVVRADRQTDAFCGGEVDISFLVLGHPNDTIRDITSRCPVAFYAFTADEVAALASTFRYYQAAEIPRGAYPGQREPVRTISVPSVLVARASLPEAVVRRVAQAVMGDLDKLRTAHWALAGLGAAAVRGVSAVLPVHPGAARYMADTPAGR